MDEKGPSIPGRSGRVLALAMAIGLVFGNMVGSGIFLLPATMAPYGGVSALGWLFTATGALLLALTFAWLSRSQAIAGGIYAYTRLALRDFAGVPIGRTACRGKRVNS